MLLVRAQAVAERDLELLALRHEVAILRRHVKPPDLLPTDRLLLAALGRRLPVGRLLFTPATVLRWHRELVRRRWSAFGRRPRRGRPPVPEEVRSLIIGMATENPRWGERRIQGELLKLGTRVSNSTVRLVLCRHQARPGAAALGPYLVAVPPSSRSRCSGLRLPDRRQRSAGLWMPCWKHLRFFTSTLPGLGPRPGSLLREPS
jgi:putative transposase